MFTTDWRRSVIQSNKKYRNEGKQGKDDEKAME